MTQSPQFGALLTEAIWRVKSLSGKPVAVIQDELGYALGKKGGASIERWRQGYPPAKLADLEIVTHHLAELTDFDRSWFETFLRLGQHPTPGRLCRDLFQPSPEPDPLATIVHIKPQVDVKRKGTDILIPAQFAMPLYRDDVVYTYLNAHAHLICSNGLLFNVTAESILTITCHDREDDDRIIGRWGAGLSHQLLAWSRPTISDGLKLQDITESKQIIRGMALDQQAQSYLLALLNWRWGNNRAAVDHLKPLLEKQNVPSIYLWQMLGRLYFDLGLYEQAESCYQLILGHEDRVEPAVQRSSYLNLARVAHALDNREQAALHLNSAQDNVSEERTEPSSASSNENNASEAEFIVKLYYEDDSQLGFLDYVRQVQDRCEELLTCYQQLLIGRPEASSRVSEQGPDYISDPRQAAAKIRHRSRTLAEAIVLAIRPDLIDQYPTVADLVFDEVIGRGKIEADSSLVATLALEETEVELLELVIATYAATQRIIEVISPHIIEKPIETARLQAISHQYAAEVAQALRFTPQKSAIFATEYARLLMVQEIDLTLIE